jgi:hypothetical protein
MPRQSGRSGGRSSGFSSSRSPSYGRATSPNTSSARPTQQPAYSQPSTPPMQSTGGGMMGGIGSTIVQGMAFGGGSEVGRQVVRSMMGGSSHESNAPAERNNAPVEQTQQQPQQTQENQNPCQGFNVKFIECLKTNNNDISSCQSVFNDLKLCQNAMI